MTSQHNQLELPGSHPHSNGLSHREPTLSERVRGAFPPTLVALYDSNQGLALIALAQLFFACMSLSVKFLIQTTHMPTLTLIFVRMGITGLFTFAALLLQGDPHPILGPPGIRYLLCWRGFSGFAGLFCSYQALRGLTVSDAATIAFLTPIVTALIAFLFMGESFSVREAISGFVSLFGVVLIARPPFIFGHGWDSSHTPAGPDAITRVRTPATPAEGDDDDTARMIGITWALVGVCFASSAYLSIRYIGKRANAFHSIGYFSMMCTLATGIAIPFTPNISWPHDTYSFCLIILIGVFGFIAQMLLTFGLQREKAGRGSLAMYLQLFFTVFLEFLVFHLVPSFLSFVGTGIILSSAAWVAVDSLKASPPPVLPDPERYSHSDAGGSERDPISRTSSPVPPPGSKTVRGELYLYSALRGDDDQPTGSSSATLNVSSRTSTPVKKEEA